MSPRTYNNYFSSREQAIVAAVTAERESRVAAAVAARPAHVRLADALEEAILEQYTEPRDHDELLMITASPKLRDVFLDTAARTPPRRRDRAAPRRHRHARRPRARGERGRRGSGRTPTVAPTAGYTSRNWWACRAVRLATRPSPLRARRTRTRT